MTTFTPAPKTTIQLTATLTSPFHHGAGSSGNTSVLRTQEVIQADGTVARVPFLSAASIRHALRDAIAWHTAHTLDIEDESLAKQTVDLLWTGGAVSSTGSRTDLDMMRRVRTFYPPLSLFGYAAKSDISSGTLRASDMILVCRENSQRLPEDLATGMRAAAFRSEEFGTRHDQATSPAGRYITIAGDIPTAQMIWDTQVITTGARLHGEVTLTPAADHDQYTVLLAALALWAPDGVAHIGAKTAQGYGRATIDGIPDEATAALDDLTRHLEAHKLEILDLLGELGQ